MEGECCRRCGSTNTVETCEHGAVICAECGWLRECGRCAVEDDGG